MAGHDGLKNSRKRRQYAAHLKTQFLEEWDQPGAPKVTIVHGINPNVLHGWRKLALEAGAATQSERFVPVSVAPVVAHVADARLIEVELRRGATMVKLSWPVNVAAEPSAWMQKLLR